MVFCVRNSPADSYKKDVGVCTSLIQHSGLRCLLARISNS